MAKLDSAWRHPRVLEAVFDQMGDAFLLYDRDRRIVGVNRAAERLLGQSAESMIGRECREVFGCTECDPICGVLVSIDDQPSTSPATIRLHLSNGLERTVVVRTNPILDERGKLEGVLATIQDVSAEYEPQHRQIIADSPLMADLMRFVRRVALSEATTVLLEGENGVGKDLIASTLHNLSPRHSEPFIAINCAAIPETLLESELFGYEKGAFTDARQQKRGLFELADNGTLFLDEIGDIPLVVQAKLLRVLEDQHFRRVGGTKDIHVNLRFIAATNKNLREAVREGAFRQDLYFRLNVIQITIPPLRERREDILPLTRFFVEQYNKRFRRNVEGVTEEAGILLERYPWPGNVRELRNAIERAMILEDGALISPETLPVSVVRSDASHSIFLDLNPNVAGLAGVTQAAAVGAPSSSPGGSGWGYGGRHPATDTTASVVRESSNAADARSLSLEAHEIDLLREALTKAGGNRTHAARLLSVTRDTLRYKMKKYGLE